MCPGSVSHAKKHFINSTHDHKPVVGDHDENAIVVMDANGLPVKDSGVQLSSLLSGLSFVDNWDASGGTYPTPTREGQYWIISVAGTIGGVDFEVGDWLVYVDDTPRWVKIDNTEAPGITDHSALTSLNWADAGHTMDEDLDMAGNSILDTPLIEGSPGTAAGIKSTDSDISLQVGDNAGVKKVKFLDSDAAEVAAVDSNGNLSLLGTVDGVDVSDLAASTKNGTVVGSSFTKPTSDYIYDVVFPVAYADANYTISIEGEESRLWRFENQTVSGFRINTNSGVSLGALSKVTWLTKKI